MLRVLSAFSAGRGADPANVDRRRNLLAVSFASFLSSVGFMVAMPVLPGLVREVSSPAVMGADPIGAALWLGIAISVSPLLTALTGPIWASLGERFGHRAMIERSLVCIGVGVGLLALAASPLQVVACRALIGALGGTSVAALASITSTTPRRDLGPAVGTLQAAQTAGAMFGPLLGGVVGGLIGMRESFLVAAVMFVVALGVVRWLYRELPALAPEPVARATRSANGAEDGSGRALGIGLAVVLIAAFTCHFVEGTFIVLLPLQLERLGVAPEQMTLVYGVGLSVTYLAATISAAVSGRLTRRWPATTLLPWVIVGSLAILAPMALASQWWQFLGLRILLGAIAGAAPTLAYSAGAAVATPERRARVVGLVSSAGILGWAASPLTAGALAQVHPNLQLALNAGLYAAMVVLLVAWNRGLLDRGFGPLHLSLPSLHAPRFALLPNVGGPRDLLDRLPSAAALLPVFRREARYTPAEVRTALVGDGTGGDRADAILALAAAPGRWMPDDSRAAFRELSQYGERLPTILYLYRAGEDAESIGRRFGPLGGAWAVERTVDIASELIAKQLNR